MKRRGKRKREIGIVVSDKMDKTVTVKVERLTQHPLYKKYIKRYTSYKAHDEENTCNVGDKVLIVETRPLSKTKRWNVKEIIVRAPEV
jgi:small subunit ribosomal protein S17